MMCNSWNSNLSIKGGIAISRSDEQFTEAPVHVCFDEDGIVTSTSDSQPSKVPHSMSFSLMKSNSPMFRI